MMKRPATVAPVLALADPVISDKRVISQTTISMGGKERFIHPIPARASYLTLNLEDQRNAVVDGIRERRREL